MREIKFRGIIEDNDDYWICGSLIEDKYIVGNVIDWGEEYFNTEFRRRVLPETVSQFTGLYDKNGKEIYEGDIVMFDNYDIRRNPVRIIEYRTASCSFTTRQPHTTTYGNFYSEGDLETRYEVIGNIHDNPELLEKENK